MKKIINANMALMAVGVLQPANVYEVVGFLETVFPDAGNPLSLDEFRVFLDEQSQLQRIIKLASEGEPFYSLTLLGSHYLPVEIRKLRDKFRAYLLRDAHQARFLESRGIDEGLTGDSPVSDARSRVKGRAPNKLVLPALGLRFALGRAYWPRIQQQFNKGTGSKLLPRDAFPHLLSFCSREQVEQASGRNFSLDYLGISVCVGMSAQMIWNISRQPQRHYRSFPISKKSGGTRTIESPRVFLKVIQWFIADFAFHNMKVHEAVHSFTFRRSIATNAAPHEGKEYVGSLDIENFFGSVTEEMVRHHLEKNGFKGFESVVLSKLCTVNGALPQGAPTSPIISNSILFDFDVAMHKYCKARNLSYTRYADDITISGADRPKIVKSFKVVRSRLKKIGISLNEKKKRIASRAGQQRVAGVVVNVKSAPSRLYRRNARAIFHQAAKNPDIGQDQIAKLGGILGFLKIFPKLADSQEIHRYSDILRKLKDQKAAKLL